MNDNIAVVVDTNMLFKCFGLLKRLSESGAKVVIPRAVYEEMQKMNRNALFHIKRGNRERGDKEGKWRLSLKFLDELKEKVQKDEWLVCGSYRTGLLREIANVAFRNNIINLSTIDLRIIATCLNLKNGLNGSLPPLRVKLLTFDGGLKRFAQKFNIELPRFYWSQGQRRFDINEILN